MNSALVCVIIKESKNNKNLWLMLFVEDDAYRCFKKFFIYNHILIAIINSFASITLTRQSKIASICINKNFINNIKDLLQSIRILNPNI